MDEQPLATELMHELKANCKRWFIAFIVVTLLWFTTIIGGLIYLALPISEISIENEDGNANYVGGDLGGDLLNE